MRQLEIAAEAGFRSIEPWSREIDQYVAEGKSLRDLRQRVADLGLTIENAIGFATWSVDGDAERQKGLEQLTRDMDAVVQLGGTRVAAPPAGAYGVTIELPRLAERYRAVLELGHKMGITPQLEIWGGSKTLHTLSEALYVAAAADHADACLLLDLFHLYKGGSGFTSLRMVNGAALHAFHINDYPADPPRDKVTDADRVYPGDGTAPLDLVLQTLARIGFRGALSLELFNREYWKQDPLTVARTGLEKVRGAVRLRWPRRGRKTEDRRQKAGDRRQETEVW